MASFRERPCATEMLPVRLSAGAVAGGAASEDEEAFFALPTKNEGSHPRLPSSLTAYDPGKEVSHCHREHKERTHSDCSA